MQDFFEIFRIIHPNPESFTGMSPKMGLRRRAKVG
jgi:hypothetical protein